MNNFDDKTPAYLRTTTTPAFKEPVPERLLQKKSAKLVFSVRLYPEWVAGVYGILKDRYPTLGINSASELLSTVLQDYINLEFSRISGMLPPTGASLDFLRSQGFVTSQSERQFKQLGLAQHKLAEYETQPVENMSFEDRYHLLQETDPEQAEVFFKEAMDASFKKAFETPPAEEKDTAWKPSNKHEEVITDNRKQAIAEGQTSPPVEFAEGVTGSPVTPPLPVMKEDKLGLYGDNRLAGILPDGPPADEEEATD